MPDFPTYLPFEDLLQRLGQQGFRIGPQIHIRIQQLLNAYGADESLPVSDLRYQLGAIIARSEAELKSFFELFDDYINEHSYLPPPVSGPDLVKAQRQRGLAWLWLALIPLGILFWLMIRPLPCPEIEASFSDFEGSPALQERRFSAQVTVKDPSWSLQQPSVINHIEWDFGDGSKATGIEAKHRYALPGVYLVRMQVYVNDSCYQVFQDSILVLADIRVQPDFNYQSRGDTIDFVDQSIYYPDSSVRIERRWDFGDNTQGTDSLIRHLYVRPDSYLVKLWIRATWPDTTIIDSISRRIGLLPVPHLRRMAYEVVDLRSYRKAQDTHYWLPALLALVLLTYLVYEGIRAWQRQVALDEAPSRAPPLRQPLDLEPPDLDLFHSKDFYELARRLRRRRTGADRQLPDVPGSVRRTADAGGFPTLAWRTRTQASQYLVLIEQHSPQDHLAALFASLAHELESRDISVAPYFFQGEPRLCWREKRSEPISLSSLLNQYPDYRLLIIGEGDALLDEQGQGLAPWSSLFQSWEERAWLSTKATEAWGATERSLQKHFVLAPASQQGFAALVEQWEAEEPHQPAWWRRTAYELAPPELDDPEAQVRALHSYLGEAGLHWLAACAWYPELSWSLTLQLGNLIAEQEADKVPLPASLDFLIHLLRLPYFRKGNLPRELREALVAELPEAEAKAVREHLLAVLRRPRNQAPPGSYAADEQALQQALFQFLNSPQNKADKKALQQQLAEFDPEELEDQVVLRELSQVRISPLTLVVPARFFRGQVPLLGLRQQSRMALLGLPLLLLTLLAGWWSMGRVNSADEAFDPDQAFLLSELDLPADADSARWYVYEGVRLAREDTLAKVRPYFEKGLSLDSSYVIARQNVIRSRYHEGLIPYRMGELQAARDSFWHVWTLLQRFDPERKLHVEQVVACYAWGMTELRGNDLERGKKALALALCEPVGDSAYQRRMREGFLAQTQVQEILELYRGVLFADSSLACLEYGEIGGLLARIKPLRLNVRSAPRSDQDNVLFRVREGEVWPIKDLFYPPVRGEQVITRRATTLYQEHSTRSLPAGTELLAYPELSEIPGYVPVFRLSGSISGYVNKFVLKKANYTTWYQLEVNGQRGWVDEAFIELVNDRDIPPLESLSLPAPPQLTTDAPESQSSGNQVGSTEPTQQPLPNSEISGYVYGPEGKPLSGVRVQGMGKQSGSGNIGDFYLLAPLAAEAITLRLSKAGYVTLDTTISTENLSPGSLRFTLQEEPKAAPGYVRITSFTRTPLVRLEGGTFLMGSDPKRDSDAERDEAPEHEVTLSTFSLEAHEVTNAQFAFFLNQNGQSNASEGGVTWYDPEGSGYQGAAAAAIQYVNGEWQVKQGRERISVNYVSWYGARAYATWLSRYTGEGYRLPTEAEWEYAAGGGPYRPTDRAGRRLYRYAGSNDLDAVAWYSGNAKDVQPVQGKAPVHPKLPIYDMSGNVWEWCSDGYGFEPYPSGKVFDPKGSPDGKYRVLRGGSWVSGSRDLRVAFRYRFFPTDPYYSVGFRCASSP